MARRSSFIFPKMFLLSLLIAALGIPTFALINPNFTPINLVDQSGSIYEVKVSSENEGSLLVSVQSVLKGKKPAKPFHIDLTKSEMKAHVKGLQESVAIYKDKTGLLIIGEFKEDTGDELDDDNQMPGAFLHLGGNWTTLYKTKTADVLRFDTFKDSKMNGTWNSSTDMFIKVLRYIIANPDEATVPTETGTILGDPITIGTLQGAVGELKAVQIAGKGICLFAAGQNGDHIWQFDKKAKKYVDITTSLKLTTKSTAAAWGDFNGDNTADLVSWNGKTLEFAAGQKDGTFTVKAVGGTWNQVSALASIHTDPKSSAKVIVAEAGGVHLVSVDQPDKKTTLKTNAAVKGQILVADFDGDTHIDIIQTGINDSVFFKADGKGGYAEGKTCGIVVGKGKVTGAIVGDFDGDNLPDVFTAAEDGCGLFQNLGNGQFEQALGGSGEIGYKSYTQAIGGTACDLNNDGRQDIAIVYSSRTPLFYFNRGFRSFGYSMQLDIQDGGTLPEAGEGQQAIAMEDFDGDGDQDCVLALANGKIVVLPNELQDEEMALGARVTIKDSNPFGKQASITAWDGPRCLGTQTVTTGQPGAFFGRQEAGELILKWKFPGGAQQTQTVVIEENVAQIALAK